MPDHLRSGRAYVLRPIRPEDKPLLRWALEHASSESIYRRFLTAKHRFTAAEQRYLTEVDMIDHVALVTVDAGRPDVLLGVGRWVRDVKDRTSAEMAIIVADDVHRQGLGTRIGLALAELARDRGVERFTAAILADNRPAHRLFASISAHLETQLSGPYAELVAELPAAA